MKVEKKYIKRYGRIKEQTQNKKSDLILCMSPLNKQCNTAAILRSAEVFGVSEVCIVGQKLRSYKSSMGAHKWVDINYVPSYEYFFQYIRGVHPIVVADVYGDIPLSCFNWPRTPILVIGCEGGIVDIVHKNADYLVRIPQYGTVESLNVGIATGIFLFHHRQQFNERILWGN